ncbi:hypothetical protein [Streptomyces shenzhenensis]|uniref:hypothetical protein n=1 Tax=Streptomyces shenzhenensis TaxID=943815 RepID=UPI001F3A55A8|nr:hypothetical protein [Streptomyces shenzhenensis]
MIRIESASSSSMVLAVGFLSETEPRRGRFDIAGAAPATRGSTPLVLGVVDAAGFGWTAPRTSVPLVAGVVLVGLFVRVQPRPRGRSCRCGCSRAGREVRRRPPRLLCFCLAVQVPRLLQRAARPLVPLRPGLRPGQGRIRWRNA